MRGVGWLYDFPSLPPRGDNRGALKLGGRLKVGCEGALAGRTAVRLDPGGDDRSGPSQCRGAGTLRRVGWGWGLFSDAGSSTPNAWPAFRRGGGSPHCSGSDEGLLRLAFPPPTPRSPPRRPSRPTNPRYPSPSPPSTHGPGARAGPAGWIRGDPRGADSRKQ